MFGYITINQDELKGKDIETYRHYYCGLCEDLKKSAGNIGRATLTYDMVFLAILLTGLYEGPVQKEIRPCLFHGGKRMRFRNPYTAYAADMNILLSYHNLMDDWIDEKKKSSRIAAGLLKKSYHKIARKYPEKEKAVRVYLKKLHRAEKENNRDPDLASGLTGELMREIYHYQDDLWSEALGNLGFYLGKYIYLRDAVEDVQKDSESGNYNPFSGMRQDSDFEERTHAILVMQAAAAARIFERLPIVRHADILRNILYSGLWVKTTEQDKCKRKKYDTRPI